MADQHDLRSFGHWHHCMARVTVSELTLQGVWHVVKNMRSSDWTEISNLVPRAACTVDGIAMMVIQHSGVGFVIEVDEKPACVVQLVQRHEGCWSAGLFATDDWPLCWRSVLKEIRHIVVPTLLEHGARYCEAHVLASNIPAQTLLKRVGFRQKSELLTNYGAFGKDFILFAVTREELSNVYGRTKGASGDTTD
jgi:RimJ/RimL family protein N-acetyltransferase